MKRFVSILLCLILVIGITPIGALPAKALTSGDWVFTAEGGKVTITEYTGHDVNVTIPSRLNDMPVTVIGQAAFKHNSTMATVTIPTSVTSIGMMAFGYCTALAGVTVPATVTSIGESAFAGCSNLAAAAILGDVAVIQPYTFYRCSSLTNLSLPLSVTEIKMCAFYDCDALDIINYGGSMTAWSGITIGDSNDPLSACAIVCASGDDIAFGYCGANGSNIVWIIHAEDDGRNCLNLFGSGNMADYSAPADAPWYPLRDSFRLIWIPDGITSIGSRAFQGYSLLDDLSLPNTLVSIGSDAFTGCSALKNITYEGNRAQWNGVNVGSGNGPLRLATVWYNSGYIGKDIASGYCGAAGDNLSWTMEQTDRIRLTISGTGAMADFPADYQEIPWEFSYSHYFDVESVVIEPGVTRIGDSAFLGFPDLTDVSIPTSVTSIGKFAFYSCDNLSSITIPAGVTSIEHATFEYCSNLKSIALPVSLKSVGSSAFEGCDALEDVYYGGMQANWDTITVQSYNDPLTSANIHYQQTPVSLNAITPNTAFAIPGETVTWTAVSSAGIGTVKYRFYLYRDGAPIQKGSYGNANFVRYTVTEPGLYTVRVYAKDEIRSVSLTGGEVSVAPEAPAGVKLTSDLAGITVTWNPVPGAAKYRVTRTVDGVTTKVKVSGTSWTDKETEIGKLYTYSVQAQTVSGIYSAASDSKSLYYPLGIAVKVSGKKANVSWTPMTNVTKYQVYRRPQVNGKYGAWTLVYSGRGTFFTDTPGAGIWQYRVRAVYGAEKTPYSNRKKVTIS